MASSSLPVEAPAPTSTLPPASAPATASAPASEAETQAAKAAAAATADPSAVASMSGPGQDPHHTPGDDSTDTAPPSDQRGPAPLEATIRPPTAAATTPETGALHHPHHQPTPHATATRSATLTVPPTATAIPPAAAVIAATTTSTSTVLVPGATHPNIIKQTPSLDSKPPPMSPVSSPPPTDPAPAANAQPQHSTSPSTSKMLFSDIYKSPRSPLAKFRHSMSQQPLTLDLPDYDPDLLSKDKVKQKEAVKKHLATKVRNDWEFVWPPVASPPQPKNEDTTAPTPAAAAAAPAADAPAQETVEQPQEPVEPKLEPTQTTTTTTTTTTDGDAAVETMDSDEDGEEEELSGSDAESVYSTVSEDPARFRPRLEWVSDLSDEEPSLPLSLSPFRFDSPDAIGVAVKASVAEKRAQRRRALREEMQWNEGLACFEARRNAWTGARTVRVRAKPTSPTQTFSPLSPRRLFFRSSISQPPPAPQGPASPASPSHSLQQKPSNDASTAVVSDGSELTKELSAQKSKESARSAASPASVTFPVETIIPVPAPLLPPANPMRASITPSMYISLYEKVIVHTLTPSCPVNLSDMIRACVVGWKRDGEWPPKPSAADPGVVAVRRRKKAAADGQNATTTRRMSFGFLSRGEKTNAQDQAEGGGKGIRKSLQKVLGLGHHNHPSAAAGGANGNANGATTNGAAA